MRLALFFVAATTAYAAGLTATPPSISWSYVSGSHNNPSQYIALISSTGATAYSATAVSENGWLLVNSAYVSSSATMTAYLTVANPIDRLDAGIYQGTVNFTDANGNTAAVTVNLTITGGINPNITAQPSSLTFSSPLDGPPQAQNIQVTGPTAGGLQVQAASGVMPNWLRPAVTGAAGVYSVVVTVVPVNLPAGVYSEGLVLRIGSVSTTVPVKLTIQVQSALTASPPTLTFDYTQGGPPPNPLPIFLATTTGASIQFTATSQVQSGNWLSVPAGGAAPGTILASAQNVTSLASGFYPGLIYITPVNGFPLVIPVSLTVRPAPVISVSALNVSFSFRSGEAPPPPIQIQISGGGSSSTFTVQNSAPDWLVVTQSGPVAPALLSFSVKPGGLTPGDYHAAVTVTGTGTAKGAAVIDVSLQVLAANVTVIKVVNAAGYQEGGIAPGELVTIFGSNLAGDTPILLTLDDSGKVSTSVNGLQVLFNGTPAPLIYGSVSQVSAVAPYDLVGRSDTTVQVVYKGQPSKPVLVPVVTAAPGIFTADASGTGAAAATTGTAGGAITLYLTGEGQTAPAGETGKVTVVSPAPPVTPAPVLPLSVMLAGQPVDYLFAGEAPGTVAGVLQVNVSVPQGMAPGVYPITVSIGGKTTQPGVTVKIQ